MFGVTEPYGHYDKAKFHFDVASPAESAYITSASSLAGQSTKVLPVSF